MITAASNVANTTYHVQHAARFTEIIIETLKCSQFDSSQTALIEQK